MIDVGNYIASGDQVIAVPKSIHGDCIRGRALEISEFVLERDGTRRLPLESHRLSEEPVHPRSCGDTHEDSFFA